MHEFMIDQTNEDYVAFFVNGMYVAGVSRDDVSDAVLGFIEKMFEQTAETIGAGFWIRP